MSEIEVELILEILLEVDGGCDTCAKRAIIDFNKKFPEHKERMVNLALERNSYLERDDFN